MPLRCGLAGQGVNSALEDVCVLERQLFEASAGDLSQALPAFEQQRLPDSAALVKLVQVRAVGNAASQKAWFCKTWPAQFFPKHLPDMQQASDDLHNSNNGS